jgi:hypothetical protein
VNLIWLTRLIDATIGPVLASQAMQRLDPCEALLCMDRLRESTATPFPFLWYFWTTLTILCVVMHILSTKMMGNDAITDLTVPAPKFRGFFARWFGPTFALTRFLWLCLTTLYCVLSIAVMHRGASVELYIRLESGIVAIIALVAIMTVIFSNLSHTSGYDAVSMFVLPLAGVMLVLVSVFVAGLIVAARVHAHLLPGQNHPAPSEILSQNVHAAITNATSTAANSFAEGHLEVCWEAFRSFLTTLWNSYSVTWSPSTWAHIDLCGSGAALLLTIVYERLYDTQAKGEWPQRTQLVRMVCVCSLISSRVLLSAISQCIVTASASRSTSRPINRRENSHRCSTRTRMTRMPRPYGSAMRC